MVRKDQVAEQRRVRLLEIIRSSTSPVKAVDLARATGVSRQVIVQDIALLRARDESIMATPKGYLYLKQLQPLGVQKEIVSRHTAQDTEDELNILVDHGVTVINVGIVHSVYGKIFRSLGLRTRMDVQRFIRQLVESEASLLSSLTDGVHVHTLEAPNQELIDSACAALRQKGYLID